MTLTDGAVAALARQAVDLLDPNIDVSIEPADQYDPYARGEPTWLVWPLLDGHRSLGIHVYARDGAVASLARLLDGLSDDAPESSSFWSQPFPPCPGHPHPATVSVADDGVLLTCPDTGSEIGRIHPVAAP